MPRTIGILALQGAFREHGAMISSLGASHREIRQARDLAGVDGLILPGGESTTMGKLLQELGIFEPMLKLINAGMPVFGTCAGLILLCREIAGSSQPRLGVLDAEIERNAFGRQTDSFETELDISAWGARPFPAIFIRAPLIKTTGAGVEILATLEKGGEKRPVAIRQKNILGVSFHPELSKDTRWHEYFLNM